MHLVRQPDQLLGRPVARPDPDADATADRRGQPRGELIVDRPLVTRLYRDSLGDRGADILQNAGQGFFERRSYPIGVHDHYSAVTK